MFSASVFHCALLLFMSVLLLSCFLVYPGHRNLAYGVIAGRQAHTGELLFWTLLYPPPYSLIQFGPCLHGMAQWVECYWNPFALFTCGDNNHIKVITANALRSLMWFPLWRFNIFPCTIVEHTVVAIWRKNIIFGFIGGSHLVSSFPISLTPSWWCHAAVVFWQQRISLAEHKQVWCLRNVPFTCEFSPTEEMVCCFHCWHRKGKIPMGWQSHW